MLIWVLIAIYLLILLIEIPSLVKRHLYKELMVFGAFFLTGVYMSLAFFYQWPLAGPIEALSRYFS